MPQNETEITEREAIIAILKSNGIDPDQVVNGRTTFSILEAAVWAGLDTIEEET